MWHRSKKETNEENFVPTVPVKQLTAPAVPPKKEDKKSIKKRILKFSGLGHNQSSEGKLSATELKRLEETKNRLFKQQTSPPDSHAPRSPLQPLTTSANLLVPASVQASPASSSTMSSSPRSQVHFSFGRPKEFNVPGLSLPALEAVQIKARNVTLYRNVAGDFGFTIRRVQYPLTNSNEMSHVVFAEPAEQLHGPPRPSDLNNGLLPGDQLLQVEGRDVASLKREELLALIQEAGDSLSLRVQVVPELVELCGRAAPRSEAHLQLPGLNPDQSQGQIADDRRYWLIHSGGYTLVDCVETLSDGRARIKVNELEMVVDGADLDKANPAAFDRANDLGALKHVNETSALHLLRNRFGSNLQFTNAGPRSLIYMGSQQGEHQAVNPHMIRLFKGCRRHQMPAHIYSTAQQVYRNLQTSGKSQSVVFTGVSGSGKSLQLRNFVEFVVGCASWTKQISYQTISMAIGVLEAFGNCSTELNPNASRFAQLLTLGFDTNSALNSARIQTLFLDVDKVTNLRQNCSTFHVFYYLWEGADPNLRSQLGLDLIDRPFFNELTNQDDRLAAVHGFQRVLHVFEQLQFTNEQVHGVLSVLAAIFHLIHASAQGSQAARSCFCRANNAQKAAELLGMSFEGLNMAVFKGFRYSMNNRTGLEALNSFVQTLYNELFQAVTQLLNRPLTRYHSHTSIHLLEMPGSNFNKTQSSPSDLSDFVYNYLNERLSELFFKASFKVPQELYRREQVDVVVEKPRTTPELLTRLIDRKQQLVSGRVRVVIGLQLNSADVEKRSEEPRGIMYILEEEAVFPGANEHSLVERVFVHCESSRLVRRNPKSRLQITVGHSFNEAPVTYQVDGWLKRVQPSHANHTVPQVLKNSSRPEILELFTLSVPGQRASDSQFKLRRATQSVSEMGASAVSAGTFGGFFTAISLQLDHLFAQLERADRLQFVHCVQPLLKQQQHSAEMVDVGLVRSQMRSYLLIDAVRTANRSYPERMPFRDFRRRYQCLVRENVTSGSLDEALDDRSAVKRILEQMQVFEHRYRLGISQVLIRSDVFAELDEKRDLCLSGLISAFQSECRLHLGRKWLEKRRIQEQAIKCIQRNISQYMKLGSWPWWKLYVRVVPLLGVARADETERVWREKVLKLENTNAELRTSRNQTEEQLHDIEQLLKAECQTTETLSSNLERESELRMRLEAEVRALKLRLQNEGEEDRPKKIETVEEEWSKKPDPSIIQELDRLRESDTAHRIKMAKMSEQLQDQREEIENLKGRNEVLEKKGETVDQEVGAYQEKLAKVESEKRKVEQELKDITNSLSKKSAELMEIREQNSELRTQMTRTKRELDDLADDQNRGASETELATLRKVKRDLEQKVTELEDELDEVVGKNELLEQNVTRLNLNIERLRTDALRETETREQEMNEMRAQYQRRVRSYEEQVVDLNECNSNLQRQLRILEQRSRQFETQSMYSMETSGSNNYKREYHKTLALLKDTQNLLAMERQKGDRASALRKLRIQLEEAEEARLSALRGKLSMENDLADLNAELENVRAAKKALEDRVRDLIREKSAAVTASKDLEEQLTTALRDYRHQVGQTEADHVLIAKQSEMVSELEAKKQELAQQLADAQSQVSYFRNHFVESHKVQVLEHQVIELKSRITFERSERSKLEAASNRLQDEVDRLEEQLGELQRNLTKQQDLVQKHKRDVLTEQEVNREMKKREEELALKYKKARDEVDRVLAEHSQTTSDLTLALKRIDAFQAALNAGSDVDDDEERLLEDVEEELELDDSTQTAEPSTSTQENGHPAKTPPVQLSTA